MKVSRSSQFLSQPDSKPTPFPPLPFPPFIDRVKRTTHNQNTHKKNPLYHNNQFPKHLPHQKSYETFSTHPPLYPTYPQHLANKNLPFAHMLPEKKIEETISDRGGYGIVLLVILRRSFCREECA